MKKSILIHCILYISIFACAIQAEGKPPRCDRCKDACKFAEDIDELEMARSLHRSQEIRLRAAAAATDPTKEFIDPIVVYQEMINNELNKWFNEGNSKHCGKKKKKQNKKVEPPKEAKAFMATDMITCTIYPGDTREKICNTRFQYYMNHEKHHLDWCIAGKEHKKQALKDKDGFQTSYDDFTSPCYKMWRGHDSEKERACNLKMINALGNEEDAAYGVALREARMALKALYLKCGMTKSAEAIEEDMEQDSRLEEIYSIMGGTKW